MKKSLMQTFQKRWGKISHTGWKSCPVASISITVYSTHSKKSGVWNPCWAPGGGVGFHLTRPIRRALHRRQPHYSQSGDPQFPRKGLKKLKFTWQLKESIMGKEKHCYVFTFDMEQHEVREGVKPLTVSQGCWVWTAELNRLEVLLAGKAS